MKTDIYTKVVLTVIALFLALNYFKDTNLITSAQANTVELPTMVKAKRDTIDVNIVQLNGQDIFIRSLKLQGGGSKVVFPISLEYHNLLSPLDVKVSSQYSLPVDITHVGGSVINTHYSGYRGVPVYTPDDLN